MKVAAAINKRMKVDVIHLASDMEPIQRMPSGSLSLDVVLGGGWPINRWVELIGEPSHGKTTIALKTVAYNQSIDPNFTAVWVAAEEFDKAWAEELGVDNTRLLLVETNVMEDAYQAVIDFAESKTVDIIIIDSLPNLVPGAEDDKQMEENTVGRGALLTNKFFRKVSKATKRAPDGSERGVVGMVINQYRMKIGVMHGDPRTTPGGQGKDYAYSIRCEVRRDEWIEVGPSGNKDRIGQIMKIRTIKNKTAPPQSTAYMDFYFADGGDIDKGSYDYAKEIVALAQFYEIIERRGAWYFYGERKWMGGKEVLASLREDVDLKEELEKAVLRIARKNVDAVA